MFQFTVYSRQRHVCISVNNQIFGWVFEIIQTITRYWLNREWLAIIYGINI